jgi:hypothetical protein
MEGDPTPREEFTDGIRPRWHPRVPQQQIRRLYGNDARGILDEELVQEVAIALYLRCQSILLATEAHEGRAACPRCDEKIPHDWNRAAVLTCPGCGWQTTWGAYFKTYQDKNLHGGGAVFAFRAYVEEYPRADSARLRWLLVDRLIHVFHHELRGTPIRPAACNLIGGKWHEVEAMLHDLAYGEGSTPEARQEREAFQEKTRLRDDYFGALREAKLRRQGGRREGD